MSRLQLDAATLARLSKLLDDALEQAPRDRDAWIAALDAEYEGLKPHLRDLLSRAAIVETGEFLQTIPKIDAGLAPPRDDLRAGDLIGTYRLIRELGAGGMGTVWLAERADGLMQRQVALKLPHIVSSRRAELAERMAREREILASLDHPHIAKLFDAGVTGQGQPFLAIEYVEGQPIDVFCHDAGDGQTGIEARLRLFLQVVQAVAYAHGKLVIHRDLKPANILVSGDGAARLLDFGIAKLMEDGETRATRLTQFVGGAFTPDYASPEQVIGGPLTVASDVYSLGVVLYELLADARPYRLERNSRGAIEDAIVRAEPRRPSEMAPERRRKALRGDLDTIVLKALKKNPDERYATANSFAEDLVRYLEHRPVLARPDSLTYRTRKFVARNKLAVGTVVTFGIAVCAVAAVAIQQARVARAENRRAEAVQRFIISIFSDANPNQGSGEKLSAVDLLRHARALLAGTSVEDDRVRLDLLNSLAESMLGLGDAEGAAPVVDEGVKLAEAGDPMAPAALRAHVLHAEVGATLGRATSRPAELEQALAVMRNHPSRYGRVLVGGLVTSASMSMADGRITQADQAAREALDAARQLLGARSAEAVAALEILANANDHLHNADVAFQSASEGYAMARALFPNEDHPRFNNMRRQYAIALIDRDRVAEGLDLMEASRQASVRLYGENSRITAIYTGSMVKQLLVDGRVTQALDLSRRAYDVLEPLYATNPGSLAEISSMRGNALMNARRADEALPLTSRALEFLVREVGPESELAFVHRLQRGREYAMLGRLGEASGDLEWVAANYGLHGRGGLGVPLYQLGYLRRIEGRSREAVDLQSRALLATTEGPGKRRAQARILVELGLARLESGESAAARAHLDDALAIYREKFTGAPPELADAHLGLARLELATGAPARALEHALAADGLWQTLGASSRWAGEAAYWLAEVLERLGRSEEAARARARARSLLEHSEFPGDPVLVKRLKNMGT